jgi:hypothetical protein
MAVVRYRVRRWTEFTWASASSDPEPFVHRAASIFQDALQARYPDLDCRVEHVRVNGGPQLLFSATVYAESQGDAMRRAAYRFEKALTSSVPIDGRPRRIMPPWGRLQAERFSGQES